MGLSDWTHGRMCDWVHSVFQVDSTVVETRPTEVGTRNTYNVDANGPLLAALIALSIGVGNTLIGYVVSRLTFGKDLNTFLAFVFGSLGVRAVLVVSLVWYCLAILEVHQVSFALTFSISTFVFLMGEILFFHRSYEQSKRSMRLPVSELLKKNALEMIKAMTAVHPLLAQA